MKNDSYNHERDWFIGEEAYWPLLVVRLKEKENPLRSLGS